MCLVQPWCLGITLFACSLPVQAHRHRRPCHPDGRPRADRKQAAHHVRTTRASGCRASWMSPPMHAYVRALMNECMREDYWVFSRITLSQQQVRTSATCGNSYTHISLQCLHIDVMFFDVINLFFFNGPQGACGEEDDTSSVHAERGAGRRRTHHSTAKHQVFVVRASFIGIVLPCTRYKLCGSAHGLLLPCTALM